MKLRNKKTGEIMEGLELSVIEYGFGHEWMRDWSYNSIKAFLEDWEDVKENSPAEPLIKDEKIRDIIRLWTKVNDVVGLAYNAGENSLTDIFRNEIYFNEMLGLEDAKTYTIEELCGDDNA